ncbi:zinc-dependent alcohol dehydrogenase [Deinococcus peraridilitoris]|uniref:Theronine dehydrogenase-like Zn-dependent dehydrogenase n=1 Tax=Deinococcus peraridilitoris (strain DSM 19664 / LMG 22246 / CIP 109416 / KR-200) TaxID=937777 RepID=L0A872_DEIPD|nr:zinc-binding alcohol dehydrogenase [Deinococcus peraridilitoris]AFZ69265.1 theronine dehydrogenase-like Zn-dependent dehydrogenase [Deinococcus peraridilitoris DSM 19664]
MHAQVLRLYGPRKLQWDVQPRVELQPGQVRFTTKLSAISVASELSLIENHDSNASPRAVGYQTLGCVTEISEGVPIPPGTRIVTTLGHVSEGVVTYERCVVVPDDVPDRVALAAILGEETHKGIRKIMPQTHDRILVAGAGLLGLLTIFNLTRRGAADVTAIEPDAERRQLAEQFGVVVVAPGELGNQEFDAGFECSASPDGFVELLSSLRPHGRACVLSDGNWGSLVLPRAFHDRELLVVASSDGEDYRTYAEWLWQHPEPLLTRVFESSVAPADLVNTFDRLRVLPRPVSVVVDWT